MSRIGKQPIIIPGGVEVKITETTISAKGPKGQLSLDLHPLVLVTQKDKEINIKVNKPEDKASRSLWGTFRALVNNQIIGVSEGFSKQLEFSGVGYRISISGKKMTLEVGFSHPVEYELPEGIEGKVEKSTITISGIDKALVGQVASEIRAIRKPEPYKGKGIKYVDEIIRRKAGKVVKTAGEG
ncbi:50S ribosomal protein L6 [Patescibacteria group bacterium]|nr:50S ribosomal protein L6 [Patescibacteria group bacterium]